MSKKSSKKKSQKEEVKTPPWILKNSQANQEQILALQGTKVMVGTPMYGGMCGGQYTLSLANLAMYMDRLNAPILVQPLFNESLITRGRNTIMHFFMKSDAEYMLFIDADIGFNPISAIEMILAAKMQNEPIVGATYSKKEINWQQVRTHIPNGVTNKYLGHCAGSHVIHPFKYENVVLKYFDFFPVRYLGTGFMLVHRSVFEKMIPTIKSYKNNVIPGIGPELMPAFFDCEIHDGVYLSEDYLFCKRAIDLGFVPKLAPWVNLIHFGTYPFEGCYMCTYQGYVHDVKEEKSKPKEPPK